MAGREGQKVGESPRPPSEKYTDNLIRKVLLDNFLDDTHCNRFSFIANCESTHGWKILSLNTQGFKKLITNVENEKTETHLVHSHHIIKLESAYTLIALLQKFGTSKFFHFLCLSVEFA